MIEKFIQEASRLLPISLPLQSFVATNPLWDLHDQSFEKAISRLKNIAGIKGFMPLSFYYERYQAGKILEADISAAIKEYVDQQSFDIESEDGELRQQKLKEIRDTLFSNDEDTIQQEVSLIKKEGVLISEKLSLQLNQDIDAKIKGDILEFFMLYFDRGQASISLIDKNGLYESWVRFVAPNNVSLLAVVEKNPISKYEAIAQLLCELKILPQSQIDYLAKIYFKLLGWSSLIKWLEQRPDNIFIKAAVSIVDIPLIWLCYEKCYSDKPEKYFSAEVLPLSNKLGAAKLSFSTASLIWQRAYELAYARVLDAKLCSNRKQKIIESCPLFAQAIFCIDTRSEGIRRHLEKLGGYETYGFAGFFGFVFKFSDKYSSCDKLQCPALFAPEIHLHSESESDSLSMQSKNLLNSLRQGKKSLLAPFVLVEAAGMWYGLSMLLKSIFPQVFQTIKRRLGCDRHTKTVNAVVTSDQVNSSFDLETRVNNSLQFLNTIGLTKNFAPLVLICGHGGETENNPYQASFDCGACGGNAGYINAMVACHILNDKQVRQELKLKNIDIPTTTHFIAGFHNTTRDEILLDEKHVPYSTGQQLLRLKSDLKSACDSLRNERVADLPGNFKVNDRSVHWAELIPELGLIKNAALIIGPRYLTEHSSLERRVFLHSYDPGNDTDGKLLTGILSGPLIVAHWINAQYYFSTTDHSMYGAGNKMIHNVVSGLGVIEGNLSDLKIGLPWQSIAISPVNVPN